MRLAEHPSPRQPPSQAPPPTSPSATSPSHVYNHANESVIHYFLYITSSSFRPTSFPGHLRTHAPTHTRTSSHTSRTAMHFRLFTCAVATMLLVCPALASPIRPRPSKQNLGAFLCMVYVHAQQWAALSCYIYLSSPCECDGRGHTGVGRLVARHRNDISAFRR